ncbi:TetR family transcriptional regulator [Cryobacterium sp. SO2]|uniref:TetR/AcrR family transcriptional regulator n=1 Tax=Cryobacterium sp. SO2 TaxID=1897060 RepID=UPI00223DEE17|nr:TetR family transcriptional regulator [Cryobacterium sp. SO2]WEO78850.1 TetR family transcriptional regulator [Cryobacterium sp. SO2]
MGGPKRPEQERCDAILAAAYELALTEGLDAVTARRVATAAGISPGLVFFHFQSKDGLLQALLDVLLDGTLDALTDPALAALAPWDRLERMVRGELERLAEYHAGVELLFAFYFSRRDDLFRDRIEASFGRYLEAFLPVCREVAADGGLSDSVSGDDLAATVVALVQGASIQAIRNPASFAPEALLSTLRAFRPVA